MKRLAVICSLIAGVLIASPVWAADGKALVDSNKCGSCHKMAGPSAQNFAELKARKAPDLFYAGSKFNKDWLVGFLQSPSQIRPAGTVYFNHIKTDASGQDKIEGVTPCASKLSAGDAAAVADYLMTLKDSSMKTGVFKQGKVKKAKVKNLMLKKEACNACHTFPKKGGGVSCPTFEGIGARLNPDWMISFIQDPKHWDPKVWMAKSALSEKDIQMMVNYLATFK